MSELIQSPKQTSKDIGSLIILVYILIVAVFYALFGENCRITIHDNLDSNIVWFKLLKDHGLFWSFGGTVPYLHNLDRQYLPSSLQIVSLIYYVLPPFIAYVTVYLLKVLIGVFAFRKLFETLFGISQGSHRVIFSVIGLAYAGLPGHPISYLSHVSVPLILYLVIVQSKKTTIPGTIALFLAPSLSFFTSHGLYILAGVLVYLLIDVVVNRKFNWRLLLCFILLFSGFILTDYRLFYYILVGGEATIRDVMEIGRHSFILQSGKAFVLGEYDAQSLHVFVILPVIAFRTVTRNLFYIRNKNLTQMAKDPVNILVLILGFNAIVHGLYHVPFARNLFSLIFPPLKGWNFGRTIWFSPLIWHMAFLLVVLEIWDSKRMRLAISLVGVHFLCSIFVPTMYNDIGNTLFRRSNPSYREFYATNLFSEVLAEIGYDNEYSVAVGLHPAVLTYNGISTIDGYINTYSLEYKETFRRLIAPELERNPDMRQYYDNWGGRAYIFNKDLDLDSVLAGETSPINLFIDPAEFRLLGGKFVFSFARILNASELGIELLDVRNSAEAPYTIHTYIAGFK